MKQGFRSEALDGDTHREAFSDGEVDLVARDLKVKPEEVREMETRLSGGDVVLDPSPGDDGEDSFGPIAYLADATHEPTAVLESAQRDALATEGVARAMGELDERSRRIVTERWLKVNDDGSGGMTLHELAAEYGVSAERVRQIEVAAMKKMRKALTAFA
jgi:RNA polymerase sigma-32 factor